MKYIHRTINLFIALVLMLALLPMPVMAEPDGPSTELPVEILRLGNDSLSLNPSMDSRLGNAVALGNRVMFLASTMDYGLEPWVTDGTTQGTFMVKDTNMGQAGLDYLWDFPSNLVMWNGKVYFGGLYTDSNYVRKPMLWVTDGTDGGTKPVIQMSSAIGGVKTGTTGITFSSRPDESQVLIYWSDGTAENTILVYSGPSSSNTNFDISYQEYNGAVYYTNSDHQLVRFDLATREPMVFDASVNSILTVSNGLIYYTKTTTALGTEVWKTNGTSEGTALVADMSPGNLSSSEYVHQVIGNTLFLRMKVDKGSSIVYAIYAIQSGVSGMTPVTAEFTHPISNFSQVNGSLYFTGGTYGQNPGYYLVWMSNGQTAGTHVVCPTCTYGPPDDGQVEFAVLDGSVIFNVRNPVYGEELWISDGSDAKTRVFLNIVPENGSRWNSSEPHTFLTMDGYVFFAADNPTTGTHEPYIIRSTSNPIVTRSDSISVFYDETVTVDVLANDYHLNGSRLKLLNFASVPAVKRDTRGTPDDLTDDRLIFGPEPSYSMANPTGHVVYWVSDANGNISSARVEYKLKIPNSPPWDIDDVFYIYENSPLGVPANNLTVRDETPAGGHTCAFTQPNSIFRLQGISIIPLAQLDFEGVRDYTFTVKCTDAGGLSFEKPVTFYIGNVNEAPFLPYVPEITVNEDSEPVSVEIQWQDPDEYLDTTVDKMYIGTPPRHGSASALDCHTVGVNVSACNLTFKPDKDFVGQDSLTVYAFGSGNIWSETARVIINVNAANDDPPVMKTIPTFVRQNEIKPYKIPLSGIAAGPYETGAVTIAVSTDNPAMLVDLAVDYTEGSEGTLTFTLHPEEGREAVVTVTLSDGVNETEYTFNVIVTDNPPLYLPMLGR